MELSVTVPSGSNKKEVISVNAEVFDVVYNEALIHQVAVAHMAAARSGTAAQKTRAEVRGGGIKPWRQKGTGRARVGSSRNPVWVGGGRAFAAKTANYEQKVNRKMYRGAMRSILAELIRTNHLLVVSEFNVAEPKTKLLVEQLKALELSNVLIVTEALDQNLFLAARNIPEVMVIDVQGLNPVLLMKYEKIVMTAAAIKELEGKLA